MARRWLQRSRNKVHPASLFPWGGKRIELQALGRPEGAENWQFLWTSYGLPMEYLWTSYGTTPPLHQRCTVVAALWARALQTGWRDTPGSSARWRSRFPAYHPKHNTPPSLAR